MSRRNAVFALGLVATSAMVLPSTGAAAPAGSAEYRGNGIGLTTSSDARSVTHFQARFSMRCRRERGKGSFTMTGQRAGGPVNGRVRNGRFAFRQTLSRSPSLITSRVTGRFSADGKVVRGTFTYVYRLASRKTGGCTAQVRFRAPVKRAEGVRPDHGGAYSATTTQGLPVSFRLKVGGGPSGSTGTVSDLSFRVRLDCGSDGEQIGVLDGLSAAVARNGGWDFGAGAEPNEGEWVGLRGRLTSKGVEGQILALGASFGEDGRPNPVGPWNCSTRDTVSFVARRTGAGPGSPRRRSGSR
jgi:hypothetical protein